MYDAWNLMSFVHRPTPWADADENSDAVVKRVEDFVHNPRVDMGGLTNLVGDQLLVGHDSPPLWRVDQEEKHSFARGLARLGTIAEVGVAVFGSTELTVTRLTSDFRLYQRTCTAMEP
jgi:hypothetical protein